MYVLYFTILNAYTEDGTCSRDQDQDSNSTMTKARRVRK